MLVHEQGDVIGMYTCADSFIHTVESWHCGCYVPSLMELE